MFMILTCFVHYDNHRQCWGILKYILKYIYISYNFAILPKKVKLKTN